jgi:hypothetical protein
METPIETPPPTSGLTIDDIKNAIRQAQEDRAEHPALSILTDDVPEVYSPDDEPDQS